MMSIGSKFSGLIKPLNINSNVRLNLKDSQKITTGKYLIDNVREGYSLIEKETLMKTKYLILTKNSNETAKKAIYYIHGGFYTEGLTTTYESFIYPLCDLRNDIEIYLLDYSLAPKNTYPTQLNEAQDVWNEILKKYTPNDIIIGSDSSGGNIALSLIQRIDERLFPKASFFISPWTDMTCSGKSYFNNYQKDITFGDVNSKLTKAKLIEFKNSKMYSFIGNANRDDPLVSPLFGNYKFFPKSLFIVGGNEMLLDDTLKIVEKIKNKGNEVELMNKENMSHNFPLYLNFIPEANEAYKKIKDFILESF
ncbi:alpha/beta-hydrolase [Neocallimastix lanati (nom. inval.)]|nr:alpha/beta-hydrolase [Neocallimastix sp. JGI-2020a]